MQSKFKIGDKVKIRINTWYYHQSHLIGVIDRFEGTWYHVIFPDINNTYENEDLELVDREIKQFGIVDFCNKHYNK